MGVANSAGSTPRAVPFKLYLILCDSGLGNGTNQEKVPMDPNTTQ